MNFDERNALLPDYDLLEDEVSGIVSVFEQIKEISKEKYDLDDLNDYEVENALFELYMNRLEPLRDDIDKIVTLDYITNFFRHVYPSVYGVIVMADDPTSLGSQQNLFSLRRTASNNNRHITNESFNKYFCLLSNGNLENNLNGDSITLDDDLLIRIKNKGQDLFRAESKRDPKFQAAHLPIEYNFDESYWRGFADELLSKKDELLSYFSESDKKDLLEDFTEIADIYYLYASYYKMTSNLDMDKKRTK